MAVAVEYNTRLDPDSLLNLEFEFLEDDELTVIDVSAWTFAFTLTPIAGGAATWTVNNSGFARPTTNKAYFTKTIAEVAALVTGLYTISLKATNSTNFSDDEIVYGTFQR